MFYGSCTAPDGAEFGFFAFEKATMRTDDIAVFYLEDFSRGIACDTQSYYQNYCVLAKPD
jgi:hypothetical protein